MVLLLSTALVFSNLLLDLIKSELNHLVHVGKILNFVEFVLLLLEVLLKGGRSLLTTKTAFELSCLNAALNKPLEANHNEGEDKEEVRDEEKPVIKLAHECLLLDNAKLLHVG